MTAKAQREEVPSSVLSFLRDRVDKDQKQFWSLLEEWYRDEDGSWFASWGGFFFPQQWVDLQAVSFKGDANFVNTFFPRFTRFGGSTFEGDAYFREAEFREGADFGMASFAGDVVFEKTLFHTGTDFQNVTVQRGAYFVKARFAEGLKWHGNEFEGDMKFVECFVEGDHSFLHDNHFRGETSFEESRFAGTLEFLWCDFDGETSFAKLEVPGLRFLGPSVGGEVKLAVRLLQGFPLEIARAGSARPSGVGPTGQARISFGAMSLHPVVLRSLDAGAMRFKDASDLEHISLYDVTWPRRGLGYRLADEDDLEAKEIDYPPSPAEVERLYRGLRKNREDQNDRVGAHRWYFAEMEVGRKHGGKLSLRWLARTFYRHTSGYGLSAARPLAFLLLIILVGCLALSISNTAVCLLTNAAASAPKCATVGQVVVLVLRSVFFQSPQEGVVLSGVLANIVWIMVRIGGAAMLLFLGIAFRNQVAR
jgi:hypothetical protein